jgi:two-component system, chemotaxis family, chemotaxis protein CheY
MSRLIFTIDDSRTIRDLLRTVLTGAGYRVEQAVDGIDGLERLDAANCPLPAAIITDVNMPRLDGLGFIERARERTRLAFVPILVLTTESDPAKKARARAAGATGWIVKPFEPDVLLQAVSRVTA